MVFNVLINDSDAECDPKSVIGGSRPTDNSVGRVAEDVDCTVAMHLHLYPTLARKSLDLE